LQKQREVQSRKEVEKERLSTRSALEITLEKRAQRLEEVFIPIFILNCILSKYEWTLDYLEFSIRTHQTRANSSLVVNFFDTLTSITYSVTTTFIPV
jgi:hypothetical protein